MVIIPSHSVPVEKPWIVVLFFDFFFLGERTVPMPLFVLVTQAGPGSGAVLGPEPPIGDSFRLFPSSMLVSPQF